MKPILRSAVPGRAPADEIRDLKPWVRRVATGYVLLLVPVLVLIVALMIIHAPRVFATAYDSIGVRWSKVTHDFNSGQPATGAGDMFQVLALVLPAMGMVVSTGRVGKRVGSGALNWSAGSPLRRAVVVAGTTATVGLAAYTWWPNGDYRPIQPGERGTLQGAVQDISAIPTGRPSLTPARASQLHGAPFEHKAAAKPASKTSQRNGTTTTTAPALTTRTQTSTTATPTATTTTPAPSSTGTTTTPTGTTTSPTPTDTSTSPTPTDTTTSPTPTDTTTSPTPTSTTTTTP
jgi:hypothetical protein